MHSNIKFFIKPLNDDIKTKYENHQHFHSGDSGLDLYNGKVTKVKDNQYEIDFLFQCEMIKYNEESSKNLSFLLVPRSSIVKTNFRMSNSIGVIDAGYRGNLKAFVDVINNDSDVPKEGERMFQIILGSLEPIDNIEIVDTLSETSRGHGGFGSTGKK
jgi:dUTP pyrophosphatase